MIIEQIKKAPKGANVYLIFPKQQRGYRKYLRFRKRICHLIFNG